MSSFKSDKQKVRKLSYPGNFSVELNDRVTDPDNGKEGFVKADQLYYFKKDKINFNIIGEIKEDKFNELIEFINNLECDFQEIIGNLK
ncbi:hypothetical protein [Clostridium gasigenes]|uniref:hypothetical protein n=1 Tax=Clostridium gasigenes TaxID=94869 RepID=UPI001C0D43A6|nr:hypothetical protein [Clostridium gasigenes]MBU3105105.1 hypothetical protein [Clostridium gasigenes]